jgi:hypothetical protein
MRSWSFVQCPYVTANPKTKKALRDMLAKGPVEIFQPNADITGAKLPENGVVHLEGPHYPRPPSRPETHASALLLGSAVLPEHRSAIRRPGSATEELRQPVCISGAAQ